MAETRIDVIRHGEPVGGRRFRGSGIDDPLSEVGWQQMWAAIPESPPWDRIITSPLSRCSDFAYAAGQSLGVPVTTENNLKEIGFGCWEGLTPEAIQKKNGDDYRRFYEDPVNNRPTGAEPLDIFTRRVWAVYQQLLSDHAGKHVLVVAHAGVLRVLVAEILGMPLELVYSRIKTEYASSISCRAPDADAKKSILVFSGPPQ